MVLCLLPVLPPELRANYYIDEDKLVTSNINEIYRYQNNALTNLLTTRRVHETLLGKQINYSGRSVIVVGPSLALHRCRLPRKKSNRTFPGICNLILDDHPVLLNRAPTLHRSGIHDFLPILVERCAICLHPLVCKGFNADFNADQMVVHVPLSAEAQSEAHLLIFSNMKLLSPVIGDPISAPTQDMLSGLFVLNSENCRGICINRYNSCNHRNYQNEDNNYKYTKKEHHFFCNIYDVIGAYWQKQINLGKGKEAEEINLLQKLSEACIVDFSQIDSSTAQKTCDVVNRDKY
ncbi:Aspartate decarboxylase-like domain-containing protein [Cynara cardunculus var. scolymus]|uniref:DNA-directed RNA polymerase n=1 Tax=Cynara cardunculus var. scolymus TaxID=59895 RepID=A0A103Y8X7_CYNCS|nr:Aspartate decarboxylase-like domain-containing protein [Cynara cardunculus var. scolymus]